MQQGFIFFIALVAVLNRFYKTLRSQSVE